MADNTSPAADDAEPQVSFTIKSSSDQKYSLTLPTSITVGDLKQKLSTSEYANIPPERQRLIYSGRVLKDPDTLSACKIKDGNTIHLVKGAESNTRQNPANQGGSVPLGAGNASNVPTNIASGPGANNPLAQLTGARYAGMHGLPSMNMFGADGGMGAPPNPDQMLRLLDDPNFAQQMNEAMNNPAVIDMLRNNPMIRNNPMAQAAINNPELRRMMMNPQMIRMQMQMQRAMGGAGADTGNFPMPGNTDTTPGTESTSQTPQSNTAAPSATGTGQQPAADVGPFGNPFAALFPRGAPPSNPAGTQAGQQPLNPLASMFGAQGNSTDPMAQAAAQLMQNPEAMRQMAQMFGTPDNGAGPGNGTGMDPWGMWGAQPPQPSTDSRPPEEVYADQLRQLNDMGFHEFDRNIQALRRSGGNVHGAVEFLLSNL